MTVVAEQTRPTTIVVDETDTGPDTEAVTVDAPRWAALATDVLLAEGVTHGELGLLFVGAERMASLNLEHMGSVGPTDVLAFPLDGTAKGSSAGSADAVILIGDVVICPEQARAQAPLHQSRCHDGSFEDELALLVVHGVLHVLGYDHMNDTDAALMHAREQQLLSAHHRQP